MIASGLSEDAALNALTVTPAKILGLSDRMGPVDNGKMANLVVSDKPYFNEKAKVRYVFVDGNLFKMEAKETKKTDAKVVAKGNWSYTTENPQGTGTGKIVIKEDNGSYSGTITSASTGKENELRNISVDGSSLSFSYDYAMGGNSLKIDVTVKIDGDSFEGTMTAGQYGSFPIKATRDPKSK